MRAGEMKVLVEISDASEVRCPGCWGGGVGGRACLWRVREDRGNDVTSLTLSSDGSCGSVMVSFLSWRCRCERVEWEDATYSATFGLKRPHVTQTSMIAESEKARWTSGNPFTSSTSP